MNKLRILTLLFFGFLTIFAGSSITVSAQATNPTQAQTDNWRKNGKCSDPWVSAAVYNGVNHAQTSNGSDGECDITQYNNGQWSNYDQLMKGVEAARADMRLNGFKWDAYTAGAAKSLFLLGSDNKIIFARLIGTDSAGLIGTDSAGLVGNDGASIKAIISRLVAAGGGNVVPTGAGTLKSMGLISNASSAAILSNANAGMLSIVKFTPTFNLNAVAAKRSFKIGSARYVFK